MDNLRDKLYEACCYGDVATVKELLNSDSEDIKKDPHLLKRSSLSISIKNNKFHVVELLINHFKSVNSEDNCIQYACEKAVQVGNLKALEFIVDNFRTDEDLRKEIGDGNLIANAIRADHLNVVEYLINLPEMKESLKNDNVNNKIFLVTCANNNFNILQFLVFNSHIRKTSYIEGYIKSDQKIENIYELKELNQSLNEDLVKPKQKNKKNKV